MGKSFDLSLVLDFIPELLRYLHITLIVLGGSIVLGLVGGVLLAVPRAYPIPILSQLMPCRSFRFRGHTDPDQIVPGVLWTSRVAETHWHRSVENRPFVICHCDLCA